MSVLLALHLGVTLLLCGLIWTVQLVHYPLLARSGERLDGEAFRALHADHCRRIAWLVVPLMPLELAGALLALVDPAERVPTPLAGAGLAAVLALWACTALVQAPLHRRLARGFDERVARRLVASNWLRTAAWSARAVLVLAMAGSAGA